MKKVVVLLVLALATVSFGQTVDIVLTDVSDGGGPKVQIGYQNNGVPEADLPVGLALLIDVGTDAISGLDSQDPCDFIVYPDYGYGDPCNYNIGDGNPIAASETAPGALSSYPVSSLVVCMGRLDPCAAGPNPGPDAVTNLVTLALSDDNAGDGSITVNVSANAYRGGLLGSGAAFATNLPQQIVISVGPPPPACWTSTPDGTTQCNGDYDGTDGTPDQKVNTTDFLLLKAGYGSNYGDVNYKPCADSDRNGAINTTDFLALKAFYGSDPTPATCTPGAPYGWPPVYP